MATLIMVSAPPTKGSLMSPTLGSSKTQTASHRYGLMTKMLFVVEISSFWRGADRLQGRRFRRQKGSPKTDSAGFLVEIACYSG